MSYEPMNLNESDGKGLCNLGYVERYAEILRNHLPEKFTEFGSFFAGTHRLKTLAAVLQRHIKGDGLEVLNVGCGPFATELFVERLQLQHIQSFDYTPEFAPFYQLLQQDGFITNTSFRQADAMEVEFPEQTFDLMIVHDVFFEKALEMESLISRLSPFLKPGGYIYFDFVNAQTQWIWRLLGKRDRFRCYDPVLVRRFLAKAGLTVISYEPRHGPRSSPARLLHWVLWTFFRSSNNYSVLVRNRNHS